jgi:hypothetical protein
MAASCFCRQTSLVINVKTGSSVAALIGAKKPGDEFVFASLSEHG